MYSTMTNKGLLTVPKEVRKRLNLHAGDQLDFVFDEAGQCRILPVSSSMKQLKRIVPRPRKAVSLKAMQKAIEAK
jgi:AbrB family looped-hinge helix DNA binding protein